jgi:hypothetical protein
MVATSFLAIADEVIEVGTFFAAPAEIKSYLDDALRRNEACKGVTVARVYEGEMKSANWDAQCEHQLGEPVSPDCPCGRALVGRFDVWRLRTIRAVT